MIIQELHKVQHEHGYLPRAELESLSQRLRLPLFRIQEVASFFPHFHLQKPPTVRVQVCHDMACHLRGSAQLKAALAERFDEQPEIGVEYVSCLGRCDRAPAATINDQVLVEATADRLYQSAGACLRGEQLAGDLDGRRPVSQQSWKIDLYRGQPDYAAIKRFIADGNAEQVIEALKIADLRGMGGAGVPAHQKWSDLRRAAGDKKYIVCNGDESEPATFKDRELLLRTPYLVLEGVILAGLLTGATQGYIYIRHEYPEQIQAMRAAIAQAEKMKVCGRGILGTERDFPVEVFVSPGGYICGEQSALIEAMEDRRAQPRNKPPELLTNGLYDRPTLVSNVETFAWAPAIAVNGGSWYADLGTNGCKGARFFSICGDVNQAGVCEVPCGITLGELITNHAGGVRAGQTLKAVALSGPSGGFLPPRLPMNFLSRGWEERVPAESVARMKKPGATDFDVLDLELDLQRTRDVSSRLMLGAGLAVFGHQTDIVGMALNCTEFFRNESCGKCVPCRIGSQKLVEIGTQLHARECREDNLPAQTDKVRQLVTAMMESSICGLGFVAGSPMDSLLRYFPDDVNRYLIQAKVAARS